MYEATRFPGSDKVSADSKSVSQATIGVLVVKNLMFWGSVALSLSVMLWIAKLF
ncbi:MAG: hypothetical protein AAGF79_00455 [Pseudomonadota bacterium]